MNLFHQIKLGLGRLGRGLGGLPAYLARMDGVRRQEDARDEREAERLDRIRNPHKYRGR